jgi:hypothetical protein
LEGEKLSISAKHVFLVFSKNKMENTKPKNQSVRVPASIKHAFRLGSLLWIRRNAITLLINGNGFVLRLME